MKMAAPELSAYCTEKHQARHRAVVRGGETAHCDQVNRTLGNQMRGGIREEQGKVHRAASSLQPTSLVYLVVPHRRRLYMVLCTIRVPTDVSHRV
ncbi:hypothetical protein DPMN_178105 [Dreissena polymorpha]|uniref:Uncharacterized protein n=1 Tax=Dreissena polymorpha TaxID=45954 RepID=A0A9D4EE07_DREPO|nr:hypothetical protein DPMN_177948 [Dreissena polymorpha]KAH3776653.1 hypothetical protein DPMN_178084 [Dreissena polymorpha]KAH3776674.1 hypothetical protein DPMN_178105 [Dreissena polymorpha]